MNIGKFFSEGTIKLSICNLASSEDNSSFFACIHLVNKMKTMKLKLILLLLIGSTTAVLAQSPKRKNRYPVGTFHQKNQNITGISVGLYSGFDDNEDRNVHTNGIRLEPIGMGIAVPLIPSSPISETEGQFKATMAAPPSEVINGFNLSPAGTVCDCITNGVSAGLIGQINKQVNGISASLMMNFSESTNGIQLAMFNESYAMNGLQIGISNTGRSARGLQIGLVNESDNLKGVQIGLWNVNKKRKLPIINWNFKD